ncbi:MAG: VCBS repeat-containing protein [Saprospiraceae bacterium]
MNIKILRNSDFQWMLFGLVGMYFTSCKNDNTINLPGKLFSLKTPQETGVQFNNKLTENKELNAFKFNYMYNGAGVGIGDINNDGLQDLYFVGNQVPDKLYLNKGNLRFEDISESSGIAAFGGWKNGITFVDINQDDYLDIYITRGGFIDDPNLNSNLLFVNQKNLQFKEEARYYKIDDPGFSIASSFFDYDNDGDLDLYVSNRPNKWPISDDEIIEVKQKQLENIIDLKTTDKLYRNNGDFSFSDVSKEAGIYPNYGYGLSVCTGDVNDDGWDDIYVANDFAEHDYFYVNFGNGKFRQSVQDVCNHVSFFSMGSDFGDINNDAKDEIFVVEMRPEDYKRSKTSMPQMQPAFFEKLKNEGFANQYMHNILQYNHGNGFFTDISQLAGVEKTDWSWSALIYDLDNDGWKDLYVTNGFKRDVYDRDAQPKLGEFMKKNKIDNFQKGLELLPEVKLVNYVFQNQQNLRFKKVMKDWGMEELSFSNGAAMGDLDNDGDLDIVVNNIDDPAFLYENRSSKNLNYLRIKAEGSEKNKFAYGAKAYLYYKDQKQYQQLRVSRGYISSCEPIFHFGLGTETIIDSVKIIWYDKKESLLVNVKTNQTITIKYQESKAKQEISNPIASLFMESTQESIIPPFFHTENRFDDYHSQQLLPHQLSRIGPFISVADVNGDGLEDFYVGNAHGQPGALYIQNTENIFQLKVNQNFIEDRDYEDMGSAFADIDGDQDLDLYVVSGGTEAAEKNAIYQDRIYLNDGNGNFKKAVNALPITTSSGSCVAFSDYDEDGDLDLFRGGRTIPDKYPYAPVSYLFENNGKGSFTDVTDVKAKDLRNCGMVTSAVWAPLDGDSKPELIVVGEWMPITVFENQNAKLIKSDAKKYGTENTEGWWNRIVAEDLDKDGDLDFMVGNLGLNYKFHASPEKPFHIFCDDYDQNGSYDIVLAKLNGKQMVPVRGRQCSSEQVPEIAKKFPDYNSFANASLNDIYGEEIKNALHYEAKLFESVIIKNNKSHFEIIPLPMEAQFSTIQGIVCYDFDNDQKNDIVIVGNQFGSEIETTRADASVGLFLKGTKDPFNYKPLSVQESGIFLPDDVKDLKAIQVSNNKHLLVGSNNSALLFLKNQLILRQNPKK